MTKPCDARAAEIFRTCNETAPEAHWERCPTLDGGMVVESERSCAGRDLLFATPDTAHILYFSARAPNERYAGVVTDDAAIPRLARWVATDTAFPRECLLLGEVRP